VGEPALRGGDVSNAPIRECNVGIVTTYCGKHGKEHPLADYEAERRWSIAISVIWPIGMLWMIALSGEKQEK
jgi:hypothetical protein